MKLSLIDLNEIAIASDGHYIGLIRTPDEPLYLVGFPEPKNLVAFGGELAFHASLKVLLDRHPRIFMSVPEMQTFLGYPAHLFDPATECLEPYSLVKGHA